MSDTIFSPFAATNQDDTVTTMGGLGGLPAASNESAFSPASYLSRELPQFDFGNFLGTVEQISQLFPGVQTKPVFSPGLTDISMTRGFYGPGEDVSPEQYGSGGAGTLFWERGGMGMLPTAPAQETQTTTTASPDQFEENALRAALGMDWSGVYRDRLRELEAQRPVTNITNTFTPTFNPTFNPTNTNTNTFTPTNTNTQTQTQTQTQQQTQGGSQTQRQDDTTRTPTPTPIPTPTPTPTPTPALDDIPFNADIGSLDEDDVTVTPQPDVTIAPKPDVTITPQPDVTVTPKRELTGTDRTVNELYQSLFGREAEQAGLDFWGEQLRQGTPVTTLVERMTAGAQNKDVGAVQGRDVKTVADEAFIKDAYRRLYGREPAADEVNYHANAMKQGMPREALVNNMFVGAQGTDAANLGQYREKAQQLNNFVADFASKTQAVAGGLSQVPEVVRTEFVSELAKTKPELFVSLFGDSPKGASDALGGALGAVGDIAGLANVLFGSENLKDLGGNLVQTFGTKAIAEGAGMGLAALGVPVVGQVVGAAVMLDGLLSKVLGYDSPIQDGVQWLSGIAEDVISGVGKLKPGKAIKRVLKFQAGGLVDMPDDLEYNDDDYEGGLDDLDDDNDAPMEFAVGGVIQLPGGGKIAKGPGGGLDDLIPTSIDGRRAAALSDGEFVIPADVVSMMGDGSTNAGSRRLYDLVKQIRQEKTGTSKQAGPLPVGKILERTMR